MRLCSPSVRFCRLCGWMEHFALGSAFAYQPQTYANMRVKSNSGRPILGTLTIFNIQMFPTGYAYNPMSHSNANKLIENALVPKFQ